MNGRLLWGWLVDADASRLRALVARGPNAWPEQLLLNFLSGDQQVPYSLSCTVEVNSAGFALAGEPVLRDERALRDELLQLNNELATALREKERARRALESAQEELDRSYWHLRRSKRSSPSACTAAR